MKTSLLAGVVALATFSSLGDAGAADLSSRMAPYKVPAAVSSDWTGFYAGLGLGARWTNSDWNTTAAFNPAGAAVPFTTDPNAGFSSTAFRLSGYAGYNWQVAPTWLVGLEAEFGWANNNDTLSSRIPGLGVLSAGSFAEVKETWDASFRGRLGYLITPQVLAYTTGGLAVQHIEAIATCPADVNVCNPAAGTQSASSSSDRLGWTVGGGLETKLAQNWLARIEYRYSDFGNYSFTALPFNANSFGANATVSTRTQTVTAGFAYKFGSF